MSNNSQNNFFSEDGSVFVVAELSGNHNQNIDIAIKTIEAAKEAGADAIKIQTYTADTITINCDNNYFKINNGSIWDGETLYSLYQKAYTPWEWHPILKKVAEENGLLLFSSPFDRSAVDFLEKLEMPLYKIASFEIFDTPLIKYVASKGKPVIMSTGVASYNDIEEAVNVCKGENVDIALLKCTSAYPAPVEEANLLTIPDMRKQFKTIVGLSDHTLDNITSIAAVAIGARIIEKHLILDKSLGGPDASFSLSPVEFKQLVNSIRTVEAAMGKVKYELSDKARENLIFSRSLFVVEDIDEGEMFSYENVRSIRPGYGMHPKYIDEIVGKKARHIIKRGTPLDKNMLT